MNIKKISKLVKKNRKIFFRWLISKATKILKFLVRLYVELFDRCRKNKYCNIIYVRFRLCLLRVFSLFGWLSRPIWNFTYSNFKKILYKYRWLKPTKQFFIDLKKFFLPPVGSLPWTNLLKISAKNMAFGRSRTIVTMGGVGVGVGAIVLLVSFAYGLQNVITKRIIWPDALKVAEATVESTSLKIDKETIGKIRSFRGVVDTAESIRLAGQVEFVDSKMDVVVVGVDRNYLKLSNMGVVEGDGFGEQSDKRYSGDSQIGLILAGESIKGQVAGVNSEVDEIEDGDEVDGKTIRFKLRDEMYIAVFSNTKKSKLPVGYVRGSVVETHEGKYVWGSVYEDLSGSGRVSIDNIGLKGKWLKSVLPMWEKIDEVSFRQVFDSQGKMVTREVFLTLEDVKQLSSIEVKVDEMINSDGMILGEIDGESVASGAANLLTNELSVGTEAARLAERIVEEKKEEDSVADDVILNVWEDSSQEIMINKAMLRAWDKEIKDVLGQKIKVNYLVTGSVMSEVAGRMMSHEKEYTIVGLVEGEDRPIVFVPIGDLESLGIVNYSSIKILTESEEILPDVRAMVQDLGLVTKSVADTLGQINKLFNIVRFLLAAFGSIALLVALFGMFNTMTVSLLERTREIGVMKSLGTSNLDVVRIFLAEAFLISVGGGILGIVGGNMVGAFVDRFVFRFSTRIGQSMFVMPLGFALLVFVLVIFVGLLTGWYPSKRASKISALNALRYE